MTILQLNSCVVTLIVCIGQPILTSQLKACPHPHEPFWTCNCFYRTWTFWDEPRESLPPLVKSASLRKVVLNQCTRKINGWFTELILLQPSEVRAWRWSNGENGSFQCTSEWSRWIGSRNRYRILSYFKL
jgi:hypothetical protein